MSDGTLSREEISALLSSEDDMEGTVFSQSYRASTTGQEAAISGTTSRRAVYDKLSLGTAQPLAEESVVITATYSGDSSVDHRYYVSAADALTLAKSLLGDDAQSLDDVAMSALSELFGQVSAVFATVLEKESISITPETARAETIATPTIDNASQFPISYQLNFGEDKIPVTETFDRPFVEKLSVAQTGSAAATGQPSGRRTPEEGVASPVVQKVELPSLNTRITDGEQKNMALLMDVPMEISVELGKARWNIKQILSIGEGTIIELDKLAGEAVDVLANQNLIARGEVVVIDESFGVRITEIVSKEL